SPRRRTPSVERRRSSDASCKTRPTSRRAQHPSQVDNPRDDVDRLIAAALTADGRSALRTLAEVPGLSVSAVQVQVRRLEAEGVIRGYRALVDPEAVGLPLAAIVAITPLDPAGRQEPPGHIADLTEVESCHSVAGEDGFVLFVRVASLTALDQLIREIRRRANFSTHTTVVLQTFFEQPAHPVSRVG
ncbi:MAG: Lrp/AsnC family transcriptional regulator, leucine-responsive regulatory protein, partial [Pseudonocardiales bacterium]|nr:Lrp/AsnC family transcriptional regulator, leucine-responsive regulatory protein [Pseudonocardiales bacterium]